MFQIVSNRYIPIFSHERLSITRYMWIEISIKNNIYSSQTFPCIVTSFKSSSVNAQFNPSQNILYHNIVI